jgi:phosphate transport system substrate-binding protein
MIKSRFLSALLACLVLGSAPAAAGPLNIVGTGDGLDILADLAKAYGAANPGQDVQVPPSIGSGGAIAAVGAGRERLGRIARPLSPVEVASGLVARPVFDIPSAFYVSPSVSVRALTSEQLRRIFEGRITNWGEVGGPDLRIRVVRREEADSTLMALRASLPPFREIVLTERSKLALTTQDAISSIRDNEGAIGFGPYSTETASVLGVVAVDGVMPNTAAYPAKVRLSLIWREGQKDPDIQRFVSFLGQPEAQRVVVKFGALPISP